MTAKHWRLERDGTFRETEPGRGTWVYHADHKRETAQLQARVAELEAALRITRTALEKISTAETEVFDADDTREMVTVAMGDEEMQKIAEAALREAF